MVSVKGLVVTFCKLGLPWILSAGDQAKVAPAAFAAWSVVADPEQSTVSSALADAVGSTLTSTSAVGSRVWLPSKTVQVKVVVSSSPIVVAVAEFTPEAMSSAGLHE